MDDHGRTGSSSVPILETNIDLPEPLDGHCIYDKLVKWVIGPSLWRSAI